MASSKFLEDVFARDIDESTVNALVGSLESQLASSASQAGVNQDSSGTNSHLANHVNQTNGNGRLGPRPSDGVAESKDSHVSVVATATGLPVSVTTTATASALSSTQTQLQQQTALPAHAPDSRTAGSPSVAPLPNGSSTGVGTLTITPSKGAELATKVMYTSSSNVLATGGVINLNANMVPPQPANNVLHNGNVNAVNVISAPQATTVHHSVTMMQPGAGQVKPATMAGQFIQQGGQGKPAIVFQASPAGAKPGTAAMPGQMANVNAGNVNIRPTSHVQQQTVTMAGSPTVIANPGGGVQLVSMNAMRPGMPNAASPRTLAPRLVLAPQQVVGNRPGLGISLQALQGLPAGAGGHLLVKTENGQFQLLRVGAAPVPGGQPATMQATVSQAAPAAAIQSATIPASTAYRFQSVTTVTSNAPTPTPTVIASAAPSTPSAPTTVTTNSQMTPDTARIKCKNFLATLLRLASEQPDSVARNVRNLIQGLVDARVEPEDFTTKLQKELNSAPQPCLIPFLKKSLPHLRQSLATKEFTIDGIRPPPLSTITTATVNSVVTTAPTAPTATVVRPVAPTPAARMPSPSSPATTPVKSTAAAGRSAAKSPGASRPTKAQQAAAKKEAEAKAAAAAAAATSAASATTSEAPATVTLTINIPSTTTTTAPSTATPKAASSKPANKDKDKKQFASSSAASSSVGLSGDDDINDVAAMGGVNLAEETQRILGSTEMIGTQIRSCKDEAFLQTTPLHDKIQSIASRLGLEDTPPEVVALISHATQERLKNLVEKLAVIAEHRLDIIKTDPRYEAQQDVKGQLKFLEELDRLERRRHSEQQREMLMKAAKSRSKAEDPEQAKLKAKAKEMQRAEMEEMRQREANLTALQAIGIRKKPRLDLAGTSTTAQVPLRPRVKRVNVRDLLFLMEEERDLCRSPFLYKSYLK